MTAQLARTTRAPRPGDVPGGWTQRRRNGVRPAVLLAVFVLASCTATRVTPSIPSPRTDLRLVIDSMVGQPQFRNAQFGILVVDPVRGDTLYSRNAGKLFIPASNQKLITGAVALQTLGADFRFATTVAVRGAMAGGVLDGDLVVIGTGDPSVSDHMRGSAMMVFGEMADSVAIRGIRRVTGRLTSGPNPFPDATLGFGWAWDDLDFPYAAGVDALYLNEGFGQVVVRGAAKAGDPPVALTGPVQAYPSVRILATTTAPGTPSTLVVHHDSSTAGTIVLSGSIGAGRSDTLTLSYRDQATAYLSAFREALQARGIVVEGGVLPHAPNSWGPGMPNAAGAFEPAYVPLFSVLSPPLRDILPAFQKPSQNQIGELLFKTIALRRTGVGSADSGRAAVTAQLIGWGVPADGFVVRDGSGLSRQDVVTPETLVRVLDVMRRHADFQLFYDALPVAGVDGTLAGRMRGTAAQGNVHAKTGTLDMVRSLSGYVTTADGQQLIAVMVANNWTASVREVDRLHDTLLIRLAQLRLGGR